MSKNYNDISNAILTGVVKTLQIMKEVRSQGDNLNDIDFDVVIEDRLRDMTDRSIYDSTIKADVNKEQV